MSRLVTGKCLIFPAAVTQEIMIPAYLFKACALPLAWPKRLFYIWERQPMLTKLLTLTFIFVLLLIQPPMLLAQDSGSQKDWSTAKAVPIGSKLRIETKS